MTGITEEMIETAAAAIVQEWSDELSTAEQSSGVAGGDTR